MIAGLILAAGRSRRMGRPKMVLPWRGGRPLVAHVVHVLEQAGVDRLVVVTGAHRRAVEGALRSTPAEAVYNSDHRTGGMLSSAKVGLRALPSAVQAALIMPGDHPLLRAETVRAIIQAWKTSGAQIVLPSFQGRRGHPVLYGREMWGGILELTADQTLRDYLRAQESVIEHVVVEDEGILRDLDSLEDYERAVGSQPA